MKTKTIETFSAEICLAGNYDDAVRICKEECNEIGLCVTVTKTEFIYTQGAESGVLVRLVQYPRFPKETEEIYDTAYNLALDLIEGLFQGSALIITPQETKWVTTDNYKGKG